MLRPIVFASVLAAFVLGCRSVPAGVDAGRLLESTSGEFALAQRLGKHPRSCVDGDRAHRVCGWDLSRRDAAWQELAAAMGVEHRIGVVCEVPVDPSTGEKNRCTTVVRARLPFETALARARGMLGPHVAVARPTRAEAALDAIESARSVAELSFLLGEPPTQCLRRTPDEQECHWWLTSRTPAYELAAEAISTSSKIALACSFPLDGARRTRGRCTLREG